VAVDQPRQHGGSAEIDHFRPFRNRQPGPHRRDPLVLDHDGRVLEECAGADIEQPGRADDPWLLWSALRNWLGRRTPGQEEQRQHPEELAHDTSS